MSRIIAIKRAPQFSPNAVEKDRLILMAVVNRLHDDVKVIDEVSIGDIDEADVYLSMGRLPHTLSVLKEKEKAGALVINSAYGIEACQRSKLDRAMRKAGIPMPPLHGDSGYWLKRGNASAHKSHDILFCDNDDELAEMKRHLALRGITDIVVSAHVEGDLMKFYGIRHTNFFRYFYPGDDDTTSADYEKLNGRPHHFPFSAERLQYDAAKLADLVNTDVYGGDCIITSEGDYKIIDFNDWPSFSPCRDEAADAIVGMVTQHYKK